MPTTNRHQNPPAVLFALGLLTITALTTITLPSPLWAQSTITVEEGGSIRQAIEAAQDGDTILVEPGTYSENIDFMGKRIQLRSVEGHEMTYIEGSRVPTDRGSVVTFANGEAEDAVLEGFSITGGTGNRTDLGSAGGGIYCYESSPTIVNCRLYLNWAMSGGGILCERASPTVTNCLLYRNKALNGGGIFCYGASPTIHNCRVFQNLAVQGGGIYCREGSSPTLSNCAVYKNKVYWYGAGIFSKFSSSPSILHCTIYENAAHRGSGILCEVASNAVIRNTIVTRNKGGGISSHDGSWPSLVASTLWKNQGGDLVGEVILEDGNLFDDPLLTKDGHLRWDSPCIDAGAEEETVAIRDDMDGESRPYGTADMGADEFIDEDGDGLPDTWEDTHGLAFHAEGGPHQDPDADGVSNLDEYFYGGDPLRPDLAEAFTLHGDFDMDRDGLTNWEEWSLLVDTTDVADIKTAIGTADMDGDGYPDGLEYRLDTDLSDPDVYPDLVFGEADRDDADAGQGDGLMDGLEIHLFKTNPNEPDTDGDGFGDGREIQEGTDPTDVSSIPEYDGIIVGKVVMLRGDGTAPIGVNQVEVALFDEQGVHLVDKVLTGPLFGKDGSFVFGIGLREEDLRESRSFYIDIETFPGPLTPNTALPMQVSVLPYPPATHVEISLEGFVDRDGDGVPEQVETQYGTSDDDEDSDNDGMSDGYEILQQMNAKGASPSDDLVFCCDPTNGEDARWDADMDGALNIDEMGRTDPNNPMDSTPCPGSAPPTAGRSNYPSNGLVKVRLSGDPEEISGVSYNATSLIPDVVTGRVTRQLGGEGIAEARVFFYKGAGCPDGDGCALISEATSQENGIFWNILGRGDYWIRVCKDGYYAEEGHVSVETGKPTGAVQIPIRPMNPEAITPDLWWRGDPARVTNVSRLQAYSGQPVNWRQSGAGLSRNLLLPLPLQRWGRVQTDEAATFTGVTPSGSPYRSEATANEGSLLNGRYQLVFSATKTSGATVVRSEPYVISQATAELRPRPGDAVTAADPSHYNPDGDVTIEDALYALQTAVGKHVGESKQSLDVVDMRSGEVLHDEEGRLVFRQDGAVGIEDALAVLRQSQQSLDPPLPGDFQDLTYAKTVKFTVSDNSIFSLFKDCRRLVDSTPVVGTAELEFVSFPLDSSGSAFRIKSFHGRSARRVRVPFENIPVPIPVYFRIDYEEGDNDTNLGTIVPGQFGETFYSIRIENFHFLNFRWIFSGRLTGGGNEEDPIRIDLGLSDIFWGIAYEDVSFFGCVDIQGTLEYEPEH